MTKEITTVVVFVGIIMGLIVGVLVYLHHEKQKNDAECVFGKGDDAPLKAFISKLLSEAQEEYAKILGEQEQAFYAAGQKAERERVLDYLKGTRDANNSSKTQDYFGVVDDIIKWLYPNQTV